MRLIDAINQKGCPFEIPDCPRSGLPDFFEKLGFKVGAEIGVYKGKFCEKFCERGIKMYAIDSWQEGGVSQTKARADYIYKYASRVLSKFPNCRLIKKTSMDAVNRFDSQSLDFVYLDADHSFKSIADDLYKWSRKVRKGGIVSGHDYAYTGSDPRAKRIYDAGCHVRPAVDAFIKAFGIENFYVFGRSKPIELESKNDRYLSWMFFKP